MTHTLTCNCGDVAFTVEADPIMTVECMCNSCRAAGAVFEALPGAPKLLEDSGATHFVLYRKDRVRCTSGALHIKQFRLTPTSKTRRLLATCCNTPLLLEFTSGHWLSMYARRWPVERRPSVEMRTMVSDLPEGTQLPNDVPNSKTQSPRFMLKLLGAWIAMGFRAPKLDYVHGIIETPAG
ncbi:MAG TPA: DUF6151 family protein [Polyangiales bacterium]|nr:DUF6151 family protein [Polyangiales bacterium]